MSEIFSNAAIPSRQVELAISRLDNLATQPCIAAQYIPKLLKGPIQSSSLTAIIESDPSLVIQIISLMNSHGLNVPERGFSIANIIGKLPQQKIRDTILSVRAPFDVDIHSTDRKGLLIHCLAVACYARTLAGISSFNIDTHSAYFAGLLHDIGKFALIEAMPRSYDRIVEQAKSEKTNSRVIEQQHLGIDHTIIGKRLAEKWGLPDFIAFSIWLHHSLTEDILQKIPEAKIAGIVKLADCLSRQAGIGNSGSFDLPEKIEPIAEVLEINPEQLHQIHEKVKLEIDQKIVVLGLEISGDQQRYCEAIHSAAIQFARRDTELSEENMDLKSLSSHSNFIKDFLLSIKSEAHVFDIAENFAKRWQKFYQTGKVCLYLLPPAEAETLEVVVVENFSQSEVVLLNVPVDSAIIPKIISKDFTILDANDDIDWLLEQLDVEFDVNRTKLVPMFCGTKVIGLIAFELHYPLDINQFKDRFKTSSMMAAVVLAAALNKRKEQNFAEIFSQIINIITPSQQVISEDTKPDNYSDELSMEYTLDTLAELAAGAAHELNNPLAVISGRAQLLADAEQNQENKQILKQIQENANEASEIIEDLMSFAEPPQPRTTKTDISQIIEESLQFASRKVKIERDKIQIEISETIESLYLDSAQIVSAIANIICNAVESYSNDESGTIKITAQTDKSTDFVRVSIEDYGCGMSSEVLKKATQPFFSAKPAGRKRGMGLAYAARLIQLNKGSLSILSELEKGTTVNIYLPNH